ncbi:hypothetical protein QJQ45_013520 [Haematococcus lacustris]|nr:hypothetical protein QJQ45_013520 [Haematococcus lacustris]
MIAMNEAPVKAEYVRQCPDAADGSSAALAAKSKKRQHKELREARALNLCPSYVLGKCVYGDKCRNSHDMQAYLVSKPPDLAGCCPWALQPSCPFGVTCRWAGSHGSPTLAKPQPPLHAHDQATAAGAASNVAAAAAAAAAVGNGDGVSAMSGSSTGEGAAGAAAGGGGAAAGAAGAADTGVRADAGSVTSTAAAAAAAAAEVVGAGPVQGADEQGASGAPAAAAAPGSSKAEAALPAASDIPTTMLPVQAAVSVQRAVNLLSKEVQTSLWKHRYNFSRSDEALNELGLRISFKSKADRQQGSAAQVEHQGERGQQQQGGRGRGRGGQQQGEGKGQGRGRGRGGPQGPRPDQQDQQDQQDLQGASCPATGAEELGGSGPQVRDALNAVYSSAVDPAAASAPAAAAETACQGNGTDARDGTTPCVQPDAKRVKLEAEVVEGSITSDVKLEEEGEAGTAKEGKAEAEGKPEAEGKVPEAEGKVPGKVECKEEEMAADEPSTSVLDVTQAASVTQAANITPGKQGLSEVEAAARLARAERAAAYTEMRLRGAEKRVSVTSAGC